MRYLTSIIGPDLALIPFCDLSTSAHFFLKLVELGYYWIPAVLNDVSHSQRVFTNRVGPMVYDNFPFFSNTALFKTGSQKE